MTRTILLTLLLLALGLALASPVAADLARNAEVFRQVVLWGLPGAALLLAFLFQPSIARTASPRPILLAGCAIAFLIDQSFLGVGYVTKWATFSFGAQELAGGRLALHALWALPACLVLGIWGWERALRGAVYAGWRSRMHWAGAASLSILAGVALGLPAILPGGEVRDAAFVAASLVAFLAREISLVRLFARGGLLAAGLYRALFSFTEAFVINDWYSVYFPSYDYVAGAPAFYVARAATATLAAGVAFFFTRGGE